MVEQELVNRACGCSMQCMSEMQWVCWAQVRWYSFQFLMEELAEEFQEMHVALTALLIKLPDGVIKLT